MRNTESLTCKKCLLNVVCPTSAQFLPNVPYVQFTRCPQFLPNVVRGQISDFFQYVLIQKNTLKNDATTNCNVHIILSLLVNLPIDLFQNKAIEIQLNNLLVNVEIDNVFIERPGSTSMPSLIAFSRYLKALTKAESLLFLYRNRI